MRSRDTLRKVCIGIYIHARVRDRPAYAVGEGGGGVRGGVGVEIARLVDGRPPEGPARRSRRCAARGARCSVSKASGGQLPENRCLDNTRGGRAARVVSYDEVYSSLSLSLVDQSNPRRFIRACLDSEERNGVTRRLRYRDKNDERKKLANI